MMLALLWLSAGAGAAAPRCARPTLRVVAARNATRCAGAASSLAASAPLLRAAPGTEFLRVSPTMPGQYELKSEKGSGLDEYGKVDPDARHLVDSIKKRNEVRGVVALEHILVF